MSQKEYGKSSKNGSGISVWIMLNQCGLIVEWSCFWKWLISCRLIRHIFSWNGSFVDRLFDGWFWNHLAYQNAISGSGSCCAVSILTACEVANQAFKLIIRSLLARFSEFFWFYFAILRMSLIQCYVFQTLLWVNTLMYLLRGV